MNKKQIAAFALFSIATKGTFPIAVLLMMLFRSNPEKTFQDMFDQEYPAPNNLDFDTGGNCVQKIFLGQLEIPEPYKPPSIKPNSLVIKQEPLELSYLSISSSANSSVG